MRVALYVRRSTNSQSESLGTQIELLETEGKKRGWEIVARYRDTMSGTIPPRDRPAFRQLWGALKRKEFEAVAVLRLDRLSRSGVVDMLQTAESLAAEGVGLVSLNEPALSTDGPHGKLILTIMAAVAAYERELLLQRTAEGRERAKARGVKFGRKPVHVDQDRVIAMRKQGLSYRKIAEELEVSVGKIHEVGVLEGIGLRDVKTRRRA